MSGRTQSAHRTRPATATGCARTAVVKLSTSGRASMTRWSYGPDSEESSWPPTVGTGFAGSAVSRTSPGAGAAGARPRAESRKSVVATASGGQSWSSSQLLPGAPSSPTAPIR